MKNVQRSRLFSVRPAAAAFLAAAVACAGPEGAQDAGRKEKESDIDTSGVVIDSLSDFRGTWVEPVELAVARARWDDAMILVRKALATPDALERLYPADGRESGPFYIPLERYLMDMILVNAPAEVVERFRGELDNAVRPALAEARAGDVRRLARLSARLYASTLAPEAWSLLGDLSWERGDAARACRFWELARGDAAASGIAGRNRQGLAAGIRRFGEESGGGLPVAGNAWSSFGGGAADVRLSPGIPDEAHLRLTGNPELKTLAGASKARNTGMPRQPGQPGGGAIFPAHATVQAGRVYVSEDGYNYSAYDVETGKLKGRSQITVPAASANKGYYGGYMGNPPFYCVTVSPEAVYALAPVKTDARAQVPFLPTVPMAHDPVTDKILKTFTYAPGQSPLEVTGSPLVWKRLLLCAGVDDKGSLHAVAFDRSSGLELWRAFLCFKADAAGQRFGNPVQQTPVPAFLAVEGGTLFACTNRGTVVSVDLATGRRQWAVRYPLPVAANTGGRGGWNPQQPQARTWEANPVVVRDGQVMVAPMDTDRIHVYDSATGDLLWEWKPNQGEERMQYVLGPVNGKLVLCGSRKGYVVEWSGGKRYGEIRMPPGGAAGRPVATERHLYIPGRESARQGGIYRVDLASLKLEGGLVAWPEGAAIDGANLTLTGNALVAVTDGACRIYSITPNPETAFRRAVEEAPADPRAHKMLLRYLVDKGRLDEGLSALKEAAAKSPAASGSENPWIAEGALLCAAALRLEARTAAETSAFLQKAAEAIPGLAEDASFLAGLARSEERAGRVDAAYAAYARLLEKTGSAAAGEIEAHFPAYAARQMTRLAGKVPGKVRDASLRKAVERLDLCVRPGNPGIDAAAFLLAAVEGGRGIEAAAGVLNRLFAAERGGQARAAWEAAAAGAAGPNLAAIAGKLSDPARVEAFRSRAAGTRLPAPASADAPPGAVLWRDKARSAGGQPGWVIPADTDGSASCDLLFSIHKGLPAYDALTGKRVDDGTAFQASTPIEGGCLQGGVLVMAGNGRLRALDAETLAPLWDVELPASAGSAQAKQAAAGGVVVMATPRVVSTAGGVVVAASSRGVSAFEAASGQRLWDLPGVAADGIVADARGFVAILAQGALQVRDLANGQAQGEPLPLPAADQTFIRTAGGNVAILGRRANQSGWVKVIDPGARKEVFSADEQGVQSWQEGTVVAAEGRIAYPFLKGYCVVDAVTGKRSQIATAPAGTNAGVMSARMDGRFLLLRVSLYGGKTSGAEVACFSLADGQKAWSAPAPQTAHLVDTSRWVIYDLPPQMPPQKGGRAGGVSLAVLDKETGKRVATVQDAAQANAIQQILGGARGAVVVVLASGDIWGLGPAAEDAGDVRERSGQ